MTQSKTRWNLDSFRIKRLRKILHQIDQLEPIFAALTDQELQEKTPEFRRRIAQGETLDDLLPEAYALVREADRRILGLFPYEEQVLGAIVLHQGNIAEMKTGEGKTLTATMPLYLHALSGRGAMLVTTNAYLARRDAQEMGLVYQFLGLTVAVGVTENPSEKMTTREKRANYQADILYTTSAALGFDYLMDHLVKHQKDRLGMRFSYAIVDEADAVLLDAAQNPLVISGAPRLQSNLYALTNTFVLTLKKGKDFQVHEEKKHVWLTPDGIQQVQRYFGMTDLYTGQHVELLRHIQLALRAHNLFQIEKDYVVQNGKVKLLDQRNGRILESSKLQGGQHQAIEAKEAVDITHELRSMASITFQSLFLLFDQLAGMTGTGKPAEAEFLDVYHMAVVQIPTHRPIRRKDLPDKSYRTLEEKAEAILQHVKQIHETGQPILLVTGSVTMTDVYSKMLLLEGIPHSVLNAFHEAKEAQMIAEAGREGSVIVATNMAGRGTDIKLTPIAKQLGGLAVIGTEHMENERMDWQIRGRAGRQGDPGFSQFYYSLEDDLFRPYRSKMNGKRYSGSSKTSSLGKPKRYHAFSMWRLVSRAQRAGESQAQLSRKQMQEFDKSVKVQRDLVYQERGAILSGRSTEFSMDKLISRALNAAIDAEEDWNQYKVERFILDTLSYEWHDLPQSLDFSDRTSLFGYLRQLVQKELSRKQEILGPDMDRFQQIVVLRALDEMWIEEIDYLQQLRQVVSSRISAQRSPVFEYHMEAYRAYQKMVKDMELLVLRYLMLSEVSYTESHQLEIQFL